MAGPLYKHDCNLCVYLGICIDHSQKNEFQPLVDLYYHDAGNPTVLARYSDEPGDYSSGLLFATSTHVLKEAYKRAKCHGLIRPEIDLYQELQRQQNVFDATKNDLNRSITDLSKTFGHLMFKERDHLLDQLDKIYQFENTLQQVKTLLHQLIRDKTRVVETKHHDR